MSPLDFIQKNKNPGGVLITDVLREHQRAGTLNDTVTFYQPAERLSNKVEKIEPADETFFQRTSDSFRALKDNEITFGDVAKEVPGQLMRHAVGISNFVAPALTNFFKTTGSIFVEGLAYAVDKNVREQYKAGNLDILPTITETTVPKLAKYTFAAGLETAIFRSFPNVIKMKLVQKGGVGAIEGIGFAISEGLAKDESPEEILKKFPMYGISGATLGIIAPYMIPLLKTEIKYLPKDLRKLFKGVEEDIVTQETRKLSVASEFPNTTAVPVSTPNKRYHAYLRSMGYEPYIPDEKLPSIQMGEPAPKVKSDLPEIDPATNNPRVFDPLEDASKSAGYEGYVPDSELPVIQAGGREVSKSAKEIPFTEMVPEPKASVRSVEEPVTVTKTAVPEKSTPSVSQEIKSTPKAESGRTVVVQQSQMPVGEGKTKVSRLEERMTRAVESPEAKSLTGENRATYQQMSKKEQIAKDAKVVDDAGDDAIKYITGEKSLPEGSTYNGVALAISKKAELGGDTGLAVRLASLRSTRAGQEISLLTEFDPDSPVSIMETIIKARKERAVRRGKGVNTTATVKKEAEEVLTKTRLKIDEAEKMLNDILC